MREDLAGQGSSSHSLRCTSFSFGVPSNLSSESRLGSALLPVFARQLLRASRELFTSSSWKHSSVKVLSLAEQH